MPNWRRRASQCPRAHARPQVRGTLTRHLAAGRARRVVRCYSGAGFSRELQAAQSHDIRLVGLDQLYADQRDLT